MPTLCVDVYTYLMNVMECGVSCYKIANANMLVNVCLFRFYILRITNVVISIYIGIFLIRMFDGKNKND